MMERISRFVIALITTLTFVGGMLAVLHAIIMPNGFQLESASAIQITQVYTQAGHSALVGIGLLLIAFFLQQSLKDSW